MTINTKVTREVSTFQIVLHTFCLCALVIAKPLFDLFAATPEFFVVNRISLTVMLAWVGVLSGLIPLILSIVLVVLGRWKKNVQFWSYAALMSALLGMFTLELLNSASYLTPLVSLVITIGVIAASLTIFKAKPELSFGITLLSPIIIVFPILFFFSPTIQPLLNEGNSQIQSESESGATQVRNAAPIFFVVFDELPLVDLLNASGEIDANRFPEIAEFTNNATWYANASTVYHATTWAVPAILTGNYPNPRALPRYEDYPKNLFTLLSGYYDLNVIEPVTQLNNSDSVERESTNKINWKSRLHHFLTDTWIVYLHYIVPNDWSHYLPPVNSQWGGFLNTEVEPTGSGSNLESVATANLENVATVDLERSERVALKNKMQQRIKANIQSDRSALFYDFIDNFENFPTTTLHFQHVLLPHGPNIYLPSGNRYEDSKSIKGVVTDKKTKAWLGDQVVVNKLHQRHLLQLGYVSRLWGSLINKIKEMGVYDESLIIFVADHGISYQTDISSRRPQPENFGELVFVPLIIKYPGQKASKRSNANVETIDILPTIVDSLGIETQWEFDGNSLLSKKTNERKVKSLPSKNSVALEYTEKQFLQIKQAALERNIQIFNLQNPNANLFNYEDGLDLVGKPVSILDALATNQNCSIQRDQGKTTHADGFMHLFPTQRIYGEIDCQNSDSKNLLIVLVSGNTVIGTTRPYLFEEGLVFDHIIADKFNHEGSDSDSILLFDYP